MANIQQAAKWMQEGKKVRRASFGKSVCSCYVIEDLPNTSNILAWEGRTFAFIADDLLADDWELAEAQC